MANNAYMTRGTAPRVLQYGVDKFIQHYNELDESVGSKLFQKETTDKGFYELLSFAGMGPASKREEGSPMLEFDSVDQEFNARYPVYTYQKAARITMEAIDDNVYEDWMPIIGRELSKAHVYTEDYLKASIFNRSTADNWMDGVPLLSTAHPLQPGGTNSNRLSPDLDLSEDAMEQMQILVDRFKNPDGLPSDYMMDDLVIPPELRFVAERIKNSSGRTSTTDNDVNVVRGYFKNIHVWKKLTSASTWWVTTNCKDSLIHVTKRPVKTRSYVDDNTMDTIIQAHARYRVLVGDHRGVAGTVGP